MKLRKNSEKCGIVVIGGGVVGASVARELQRRQQKNDKEVILLERASVATGCSAANAGWLTPCFAMPLPQPGMFLKSIKWLLNPKSPLHIQPHLSPQLVQWLLRFLRAMNHGQMLKSIEVLTEISRQSLDFYQQLDSRISIGFEKRGLLMASALKEGVRAAEEEMQLMAEQGITGRRFGREEILNFEPLLQPKVQGGVYFPNEAQAEPFAVTNALVTEFQNYGGRTLTHTEVFDFEVENRKIKTIHTTAGDLAPELVVLASGSWSKQLGKSLRLAIPILGGKGYSMNLPEQNPQPKAPIMIIERKVAITPRREGIRIAGTLELVDQDFSISPRRLHAVYQGAQEYLHLNEQSLQSGPVDIWRGLRPCTPDGVPMIGYSKRYSNLFYCAGHQLLGLQSAPGSARLAADLICKTAPSVDPTPFNPARFE